MTVSREEALDLILGSITQLEPIKVTLEKSLRYAVCEDIRAPGDIPRFDRSAMDGYAVFSRDTATATGEHPVKLSVVGEIRPSTAQPAPIEKGQAAGITTGGPIPPGADAVVREEDTRYSAGAIEIKTAVSPSQYVSEKGRDVRKGALIAERGSIVAPAVLGLMASLQISEVNVTRRPEVSILSVGNELVDLHDRASGHKIVASNIYMLSAMIEQHGYSVRYSKITKNNKEAIKKDLEEGLKSDILITTGGSSNAHSDLTGALMGEIGIDVKFAGVAMRPGKRTAFGIYGQKPVFALPGTPSAVYVTFYTLVLPALLQLAGSGMEGLFPVKAVLEHDIKKRAGVEHLVQGLVSRDARCCRVRPLVGPDVQLFAAMRQANGLIIVDPDRTNLVRGQMVSVQVLTPVGTSFPQAYVSQPNIGQKGTFPPPIVSIVGKSGVGKTTLLEKLVPELTARGFRIGTIKHDVHGFDIDHEGKDSWRHKQAGAHTVSISSPRKVAVVKDVDIEETLDSLASKYFQDTDVVLTEGYKKKNKPKIEIFRKGVHDEPLCKHDDNLVAFVSDTPLDLRAPRFEHDDIIGLADFVEQRFLIELLKR